MAARTRSAERAAQRLAQRPAAVPAPAPAPAGRTAALLFLALFAVYVLNFRLLGAGDSIPTRLLPFSLLREGNLDLDEFTWERNAQGRLPYFVHQLGPHIYSVSTIATSFIVTPLYVLPTWYLSSAGIGYDDVRARVIIVVMERISAAALTALSASLLFLALMRITTRKWAKRLTLLYALGTTTWAISSQALWAHGLTELTLTILCLIFLNPNPSRRAFVLAGLVCGISVANRPQTMVFAALALLFVAVRHRRHLIAFGALPTLIAALVVLYNRAIFQGVTGGYGGLGFFSGSLLEGIVGLLVSPNRGLFIYTPIMVFAVWGAIQVWRVDAPPWLRWLTVGVLLHVLVHAKFKEWWAGYTYGPRYLTDVLPALTLFLAYGLVPLCRAKAIRIMAAVLAGYGVLVQAIGVYAADDNWDRTPVPLEVQPNRVWDWSDLQIVRALRGGVRTFELARVVIGAFRDPEPAQLRPLTENELQSVIWVGRHDEVLPPGAPMRFRIQITNHGAAAWPAFSGDLISARYVTFLLARWMVDGQVVPGLGDVLRLPKNVVPQERVGMKVVVAAPPRPGQFELELRVSQGIDGNHGIVGPDALRIPVVVR